MKSEQFTFWLKGFLEGNKSLNEEKLKIINEKLNSVIDIVYTPLTSFNPYWNQPVIEPFKYNNFPIYCNNTNNTSDLKS